jgi:cell division protein FtsB
VGRLKALLLPGLLVAAAYFALFGGEYSVFELRRIRAELEEERARVAALEREVDSLQAWADSLEHDSTTLVRIAREWYGMVGDGEVLYRFADPGSDSMAAPTESGQAR